jgi:hypothetical protein
VRDPETNLMGFINKTGDYVIEPQFEQAHSFQEGLAPVKINKYWGFIDHSGKLAVEPDYDEVIYNISGVCPVRLNDKRQMGIHRQDW